jgi:hypothetical protein
MIPRDSLKFKLGCFVNLRVVVSTAARAVLAEATRVEGAVAAVVLIVVLVLSSREVNTREGEREEGRGGEGTAKVFQKQHQQT